MKNRCTCSTDKFRWWTEKKTKIVINKCFMHLLHATCLCTALVHSVFIYSLLSVYSLSSKRKFWKWNFEWEEFQFFSQELQILLASPKKIFILCRGKKDNHLHQEREGVAGFVCKNGTSLFRLHSTILPRKNSKILHIWNLRIEFPLPLLKL